MGADARLMRVRALAVKLGLDQTAALSVRPLIKGMLKGDLGNSYAYGHALSAGLIAERSHADNSNGNHVHVLMTVVLALACRNLYVRQITTGSAMWV